jgi:PEP-CTERM motif
MLTTQNFARRNPMNRSLLMAVSAMCLAGTAQAVTVTERHGIPAIDMVADAGKGHASRAHEDSFHARGSAESELDADAGDDKAALPGIGGVADLAILGADLRDALKKVLPASKDDKEARAVREHLDHAGMYTFMGADAHGHRASAKGLIDAAFTPTAVPEPSTYVLMLAGLAAVGFTARRRSGR